MCGLPANQAWVDGMRNQRSRKAGMRNSCDLALSFSHRPSVTKSYRNGWQSSTHARPATASSQCSGTSAPARLDL
jgi:hypothetical protein